MKTYTINVTQEDINNGVKGSPRKCPVALAVQRQIPSARVFVQTGYYVKRKLFSSRQIDFKIPYQVGNRIVSFDFGHDFAGEKMEPFTFQLEISE